MASPYTTPQAGLGGWTGYPEAQTMYADDTRPPKGKRGKKKKGPVYDPGNSPDLYGPGGAPPSLTGGTSGGGRSGTGMANAPHNTGIPSGAPDASNALGGIAPRSTLPGALGSLQPQGQILAASDPAYMYGQILPGNLGSASNAAQFYGNYFDPTALGMAAGMGSNMQTNQDTLAIGQALADMFTGGAGAGRYLDPGTMMKNITDYAIQQTEQNLQAGTAGVGPLGGLASQQPGQALQTFIGIVQGALGSTVPQDTLQAYTQMLLRIGSEYVDRWGQQPIEQEGQTGMNVIKYIQQKLGPTMGLNAGTAGRISV